jgi:hypothetical protein
MIVPPLSGISFGSTGVIHASGAGDPNNASTDDANKSLASCSVGSMFSRTDAPSNVTGLYIKTAYASGAPGTWTAK